MAHHNTDIKRGQATAITRATYDLIASQQGRILTAQAGARGEGAGTVSGPLNSPLENGAPRIGCPVALENSAPDLQQRTARVQGDSNCLQAVDSSNSANDAHTGDTMQNLHSVPGYQQTATDQKTDSALKCDIELARIALAMCLSALFRIWLVLHTLSSENNGAQGFSRLQLDTALHRYAIQGCPAYISRLLQTGTGKFWRIDAHGTIFPRGYTAICKYLIGEAADNGLRDLLEAGNLPGSRRDMFVDVSGSMKDFEAHILDGWYACHNNPMITRYSLEILFQRSDVTLRKLEHRARVRHVYNTAETLEPAAIPLNADGEPRFHQRRKNRRGQTVYRYQLANTYHASRVRQNPHRGQGRKTAAILKELLTDLLTGNCGAGGVAPGENNRTGRLYYADYGRVRQARRKGKVGIVYSPARPGERGHVTWDVWA